MNEATDFDWVIENRTGVEIAALEEIAYRNRWVNKETLEKAAKMYGKSPYEKHLRNEACDKVLSR